jgi:hypothetical protein
MCNAQGLDDLENHGSTDDVARRVLAVGVVGLEVEFGVVARLGRQRRPEPGKQRSAWGWGGWVGGSALLTGTHTLCTAHIMRLRAVGCNVTQLRQESVGGERDTGGQHPCGAHEEGMAGGCLTGVWRVGKGAGAVEGSAHSARAGWVTCLTRWTVSVAGN